MGRKLAVIALGGNAILRGDQAGTIEEQEQNGEIAPKIAASK